MANCAKALSIMGASIIIAAGLAGVAISIYLFVQNKIWDSIIGNYQLTFAILFIVVSCLVTLTGAFGVFGACSSKKCLLHTFWIFLLIWVCAFIAAGVVAVILPSKVLSQGCTSDTFPYFSQLNTRANSAFTSDFCKTGCPCYVANSSIQWTYSGANTLDTTLPKNINQCSSTSWSPSVTDSVMAALQLTFSCTKWCPTGGLPIIFFFSNNDKADNYPTDYCFSAFSNFFSKYGKYVYIASFVFAGVLLLIALCTWIYICQINDIVDLNKY